MPPPVATAAAPAPKPPAPLAPGREKRPNTGERQRRTQYLRRPDVAAVMDDLVSQCLREMPEDPASFILHHLEQRVGSGESVAGSDVTRSTGTATTAAAAPKSTGSPVGSCLFNPAAPAGAVDSVGTSPAAEDLLRWLCDNADLSLGDPKPLPTHCEGHPLADKVIMLQRRLQVVNETAFNEDEMADIDPKDRGRVVRSVTLASQALVMAGEDPVKTTAAVATSIRDLIGADNCTVFTVDERLKTISASIHDRQVTLKFGQGIAGSVAQSRQALRINNAYEDPRFHATVDIHIDYVTKALLTAPFIVGDSLVAVVQLVNKVDGSVFTDEDEALLKAFCSLAGVSVRNSMMFKEQGRIAAQNAMFARINADLANSDLDESRLIPTVVRSAKEIVGADRCAIFKVEKNSNFLTAHLEGVSVRIKLSADQGIVGWVAKHRTLLNIDDAYKDARFNREVDQASGYKTRSILCFPIFAANDLVAVAQLVNKNAPGGEPMPFSKDDEDIVTRFGQVAGVCIRKCQLHDEIKRHDALSQDISETAALLASSSIDLQNPQPVLDFIAKKMTQQSHSTKCVIFTVEDRGNGNELVLCAQFQQAATMSDSGNSVEVFHAKDASDPYTLVAPRPVNRLGRGVVGCAAHEANPVYLTDINRSRLEVDVSANVESVQSLLVFPIVDDGRAFGCVVCVNPDTSVSRAVTAASGVQRMESSSAIMSTSSFTKGVVADLRIFAILGGHALRVAKLITAARDYGNNLQALIDFDASDNGTDDVANIESPSRRFGTSNSSFATSNFTVDDAMAGALETIEWDIHPYRMGELPTGDLLGIIDHFFTKLQLYRAVHVPAPNLLRFINTIRSKYREVPYHNFYHAVDVTQTIFALLHMGNLLTVLTPVEQFTLLLAGLCHDVDHMGLNNAFHLRAETPLAIMTSVSGQKSVLEVHHCHVTTELLGKTQLLAATPKEDRNRIQRGLVQCILATDMAMHGAKTTEFDTVLGANFDKDNEYHRLLLMMMLLKIADISNVCKPFDISRLWGIAVTEEFYLQGDAERNSGLEVTPMFDRERKVELARGQIGFISALALPFFGVASKIVPPLERLVTGAKSNVQHWDRVLKASASK